MLSGPVALRRAVGRIPPPGIGPILGAGAAVIVVGAGLVSVTSERRLIEFVVAAVLVVVCLRWLVAATVLFLIASFPSVLPASLGAGATITKPFGALLACSCALTLLREPKRPFLFRDRPVLASLLVGYLMWAALSLLWASSVGTTASQLLRLVQAIVMVVVLFTVAASRRDLLTLMAGYVAASTIWSVYALASGTTVAAGRLTGGIDDPNYLASELVLAIILGGYMLGAAKRPRYRIALAFAVAIDLTAFLLTQSRGGLVGMAIGILAAIVVAGRSRATVVGVTALAVAVAVAYVGLVAPASLRHRLTDFSSSASSGRTDSWQIAWKITQAHPLTGVALGGFRDAQVPYVTSVNLQFVNQVLVSRLVVHNTYLETITELGAIGLVLFLAGIGTALLIAWNSIRKAGNAEAYPLRGLVAGTIGMLAAFVFVSAEYEKPLWMAVALLAAAPVVRERDLGTRSTVAAHEPREGIDQLARG